MYIYNIQQIERNKKSEKHWKKYYIYYYLFLNNFVKQDAFNDMIFIDTLLIGDKIVLSIKHKVDNFKQNDSIK